LAIRANKVRQRTVALQWRLYPSNIGCVFDSLREIQQGSGCPPQIHAGAAVMESRMNIVTNETGYFGLLRPAAWPLRTVSNQG
jgi:hypothetical protein